MAERFYYGGQAVIEGVMMRGKKTMVTAVRRPNGEIVLNTESLSSIYTGRWRRMPLVRGIIVLIEALVLGMKTLFYSANMALEEQDTKISGWSLFFTLVVALGFAVAIFFMAPLFLTRLLDVYIGSSSIVFNLMEGIIRLVIFVAYIKAVSLMPDIKRVFAYHGAEHMTVNAYEAGASLEVASVKSYNTAHVRCGTSFLFAVLILAIVVFSLIGKPSLGMMVLSRIVLIPVIAALGYEFTHFSGRHIKSGVVKTVTAPGLWLQSLTTRQPDDSQLDVAISALKRVIEIEETPPPQLVQSP